MCLWIRVSFDINESEFVAIMGASGSGKTTLLNCISTIDNVTSGNIFVGDENITKIKEEQLADFRKNNLGFIFQDFNLLDTLTAYENIALALTIQKVNAREIDKRVNAIAEKLGIKEILKKYPYQVSGGQKQRIASARAIITNPKLVLADEPTGALDQKTGGEVLNFLKDINKIGKTVIIVTHDTKIASMTNRIITINDGKIINDSYNELLQ